MMTVDDIERANQARLATGHSAVVVGFDGTDPGDARACSCGASCAAGASAMLRTLLTKGQTGECLGQVTVVDPTSRAKLHLCERHMLGVTNVVRAAITAGRKLDERLLRDAVKIVLVDNPASVIDNISRALDLATAGEATPAEQTLALVGGIAAEYIVAIRRAVLTVNPGTSIALMRVVNEASDALHAMLGVERDGQAPIAEPLGRLADASRARRRP